MKLAVPLTIALALATSPAAAQAPPPPGATPIRTPPADSGWDCTPEHEAWRVADAAVVARAMAQGLKGGDANLPGLRTVLAHMPSAPVGLIEVCQGSTIVHSDNPLLLAAVANGLKTQTVAQGSTPLPQTVESRPMPYVGASLLVGSLNVEAHRYAEGAAALQQGLVFAPGQPVLTSEAARALSQLGRHEDAIALCDRALLNTRLPPIDAARVHRARGYALGELGRLNEAIADYEQSRALDPNEVVAANELTYLRGRQAGRGPAATVTTTGDKTRTPDLRPLAPEQSHPPR